VGTTAAVRPAKPLARPKRVVGVRCPARSGARYHENGEDIPVRNITVASVQFETAPGDKAANLSKIRAFVEKAARRNVELIAFPECCITGYWFLRHLSRDDFAALAEPVFAGPSSQWLASFIRPLAPG
jgi:hypothetical protein